MWEVTVAKPTHPLTAAAAACNLDSDISLQLCFKPRNLEDEQLIVAV